MEKQIKRIEWIDLLRILATWGVISIHGKSCYSFETGTYKWFEYGFIGWGFTFCVPVFLMLSGYLSLKKEVSIKSTVTKRVPRIVSMQLISILLCFFAGILEALVRGENIKDWIHATSGWGTGTSYLAVLAGCYLVSPFLYKIIEEKKSEEYFLILSVVFCLIIPSFTDLDYVRNAMPSAINSVMNWIDYGQVYIPVGSAALFVLGHYLGRISDKISKRMAVSFLLIGFLAWEATGFYKMAYPEKNTLLSVLSYGRYYGSYVSPLITLYSASVFVFFMVVVKDIHLPKRISALVAHLGRNSVMIFLLHGIIINAIRPYIPVFWVKSFLLETIVDVTFYFMIAYGISLVLEHIPIVKRIF